MDGEIYKTFGDLYNFDQLGLILNGLRDLQKSKS